MELRKKKNESDADYALRSAKRAIKYILEYKKDNAYFILVLDVKDEKELTISIIKNELLKYNIDMKLFDDKNVILYLKGR